MSLKDEIEAAEAHLAQLKQRAATATCEEVGHRWELVGGASAGCCDECHCSVSVRVCKVCGGYDYGDDERAEVVSECERAQEELIPTNSIEENRDASIR